MNDFNKNLYEGRVKWWIPDICEHDLKFLCNYAGGLYQSLKDNCVDNFRVTRVIDGKPSDAYTSAFKGGCCGFADQPNTNPLTGNTFWIGFNYGH